MSPSFVDGDGVTVNLPTDLAREHLAGFSAYNTWRTAIKGSLEEQNSKKHPFHANPYKLRSISVQAVDRFGPEKIGFLKITADVATDDGQSLPGSTFMRGGSVAMLVVLRPEDSVTDEEAFTILTVQPRIPAGTLSFTEIPAGMLDDGGTFSGTAAKEIKEETGLTFNEYELMDMTKLTLDAAAENSNSEEGHILQTAVYPSPGGSDEFIPIFLARKQMARDQINGLQNKLTGLRDQGEKITLKVVKLQDAWKVAGRDAKTLSALCLYEGLRREGKL